MINQCDSTVAVTNLMNADGDRYYGWNFCNLFYGEKGTIEFRRAPGAQSAFGALCWVEFAVSFVQAAIVNGTSQNLKQYPPNVGGLKQFIDQAYVEQMNDRGYLNPLFDKRDPKGYLELRPVTQLPPDRAHRRHDDRLRQRIKAKGLSSFNVDLNTLECLLTRQ
jgi:hypothetical protein